MRSAEGIVEGFFHIVHYAFWLAVSLQACCLNDFSEGQAPRGPKNKEILGLAELGLPGFENCRASRCLKVGRHSVGP